MNLSLSNKVTWLLVAVLGLSLLAAGAYAVREQESLAQDLMQQWVSQCASRYLERLGDALDDSDVDLSRLLDASSASVDIIGDYSFEDEEIENEPDKAPDPGHIPEHLFKVPGFVSELMNFTLSAAPYPNKGLAFCGVMALQSFLAGRKVCTPGDLRTNIYLVWSKYLNDGFTASKTES